MGLSGINLTQLLVILAIVLLVFGTRRVKSLGADLGGALKGFRRAMDTSDDEIKGHASAAGRQQSIGSDENRDHDAVHPEPADNTKQGL